MFSVLDAHGGLKARASGPGTLLADPLTVGHGGLGLTQIPAGALLTSRVAGAWRPLERDPLAPQLLSNAQTPGFPDDQTPRWSLGRVAVPGGLVKPALDGAAVYWSLCDCVGLKWYGWQSSGGGSATLTDALSSWRQLITTVGVAGRADSWVPGGLWWLDQEPRLSAKIRTPASLALVRFVFAITNLSSGFSGVSEDLSTNKLVGMRFTSSVPDAGWMPITADGTAGSCTVWPVPIAAIAPSTVYLLTIAIRRLAAGSYVADLSVDAGPIVTVPIPPACLSSNVVPNLSVTTLTAGAAASLDVSAVVGVLARAG